MPWLDEHGQPTSWFVSELDSEMASRSADDAACSLASESACLLANLLEGETSGESNEDGVSRKIAVGSQKGGVGKTTTAANLAAAWGGRGRRVLAVDFDPQFGLTRAFGMAPSQARATVYEVVTGDMELPAAIEPVAPGVELLAGHRALGRLELALVGEVRREEFLRRALEQASDYDYVVIDCPPNLGLLTVNALCAAPEVVAPVSMLDPGALQGVGELRATVAKLADGGIDVRIGSVVRTCVDRRRLLYRELEDVLGSLRLPVAHEEIPLLTAQFGDALARGRPLVIDRPDSAGACAYRRLTEELDRADLPLRAVA
jgi:chromosome partitioning protein